MYIDGHESQKTRRESEAFENQEKHKCETARKKPMRRKQGLCWICQRVRHVKKSQMYDIVGHASKLKTCSFHLCVGVCFFDRGDPVAIMKSRTGGNTGKPENPNTGRFQH